MSNNETWHAFRGMEVAFVTPTTTTTRPRAHTYRKTANLSIKTVFREGFGLYCVISDTYPGHPMDVEIT